MTSTSTPELARKLGLFDATMLVIGGIVGAGIFMNPYVVAREVHSAALILGAWVFGGLVALSGGFVYAELSAQRPSVGGQYAYFREAFHPAMAFLYGWGLLLVVQTGGMAAVAMTFAHYFVSLSGVGLSEGAVAVIALLLLTALNCFGVRAGSNFQNAMTVLKMAAICLLVFAGFVWIDRPPIAWTPVLDRPFSGELLGAFGASLVPVLFAYGGWQTACFIAGEVREPEKNLPRGLILGILGVVILYLSVNLVCLHALGAAKLAETKTPASEVMRLALGEKGASIIALGIAISTLGFLSQGMLTAPRVYFSMAQHGLFFKSVARIDPRTQVPTMAVVLQGACASVIAMSGSYGTILNYVVSVDFIFYGLAAACVFIFRKRDALSGRSRSFPVPGHPFTTVFFMLSCWVVVATTIANYPRDSLIGLGILAAGLPVYFFWSRQLRAQENR